MKKKRFLIFFILIFTLGQITISTMAQGLSVEAGGDLVSRYVWRGIDVNAQPNIQPYLTFGYSGLQLGFWGSYGLGHLNSTDDHYALSTEIDTWVGYSFSIDNSINIDLLVTDYYYPNGGLKIGNYNNYDDVNGQGAHIIEAGLILSGAESFPISLSGYINFYNDKGNNTYFQADYSTSLNDFGIDFFAGAAGGSKDTPQYYGTQKFNLINVGIKVSKSVTITQDFSLPVYCSYILNPNSEIAFLVLGISI